ncbi:MAG: trigger factor [Hyphomonadaceae bacterium]|nr:trigger factor [Hyphomonadaceae bacterium]
MQCTQTQSEGLSRVFRVVVPRTDLQQRLDAKVEEVRGKTNLKGFRPGKAPAAHIKKLYGKGLLREIIDDAVQRSTREALDQADVRVATEPSLHLESDLEKVARGEADLAFHFHVEVLPEIEPAGLEGLSLERLVAPVAEAQVDELVAQLLKNNRTWEVKEGAAATGDLVTIDFLGKLDGEPFEGGAAEGAKVELGAGQFIPGFEEGVSGLAAGEEKTLEIRFPDTYAAEHLAGKDAVFEIKVQQVEASLTPTLDDAFAEKLGIESAEKVRALLRGQIEAEHAGQSRMRLKRVLFDVLDKTNTGFALPPAMVEAEFQQIWRQVDGDRQRGQLDADDAGKSEEELRADYRRIAERRVRLGLLLAEIGKRMGVVVTDQELTTALTAEARRYPGQEKQVFEFFQNNPGALAQLRAPIFEDKVVDRLVAQAEVTEKEVSREDLFSEMDAEV